MQLRKYPRALLVGLLMLVLPQVSKAASLPADPTGPAVRLEQARALTFDPRTAAVNLILDDLQGDPAANAALRAPEMYQADALFLAGRYLESAAAYTEAADRLAGTLFEDDARFCRIKALEAAGQDLAAQTLWQQWVIDFPASPLVVDAGLTLGWNLVRNGNPAGATTLLDGLTVANSWLADDPRLHLLQAYVAFAYGEIEAALGHLTKARHSGTMTAAGLMLEGLCLQQSGQDFAAAMSYQELIDEYSQSHLRGYALMAKGGIFTGKDNFSAAAAEFSRAARQTTRTDHRAEAEYMAAACLFLGGDEQPGLEAMHAVAVNYAGDDLAARALFSLGEMRWMQGQYEQAITRFNEVLSNYFAHELAGSALYRTGRCLDALGRTIEANSTYQAVADGYPYAPEAPAAVYLAGVGLFEQGQYLAAAPYFQLVLDRYAGAGNAFVFSSAEHQELVEASLCLLEYSFYQADEVGKMAGAPHLALQKMPPSPSRWRAYTLLLDADALAAVDRFPESQETLATLLAEFPDHPVGIRANRLLAWTYASQGRQDLAIATEQAMLARYSAQDDQENLGNALLTIAHSHFNAKRYEEAARNYSEYTVRFPDQGHKLTALYQEGLCYVRLGRAGDAVDRWQVITAEAPTSEEARKAWLRCGDILFQAAHFEEARAQFASLMQNFPDPEAQAAATLRLGRCDYNEGKGAGALALFRDVATKFPGSPEAVEATEGITHILYGLGREGDAAALQELVTDYPQSPLAPEAGFELAMQTYEEGDFQTAAENFDDLCGRYPRYSAADRNFYYAADSWEKAGAVDRARNGWTSFLNYFPHSELAPGALFRLASIQFNDGQYNVALEDFNKVMAMPAEEEIHAASLYNQAMCHRILGHKEEALEAFAQYLGQAAPDDARAVAVARSLGEIHQEMGHLREAARQYGLAAELGLDQEEAVELNYLAGICLKEAGDFKGALGAYAQSIASQDKTNNFRLSALAQTADLHERGGNFDGALTAYRDLIENAVDPALVGAAKDRVAQLEAALGR